MFLRAISRPLLAKVKQSTGIVGLAVVPNAREVLIELYSKTLKEVQALPEDGDFRKAVEHFARIRLKVCEEESDWETIEQRIACGQVEELIQEARADLTFVRNLIEWEAWDPDATSEDEVVENDSAVPKYVPPHRPGPRHEAFYNTLKAVYGPLKKRKSFFNA